MNWKKFLFWSKDRSKKPAINHFDVKLLKQLQRRSLPTAGQLKYLPRFLNQKEKIIISVLSAVAGITAMSWLVFFVVNHHSVAPQEGGEYMEAIIGQPKLVNPIFSSVNDVDQDMVSLMYSGLFRYDKEQKLIGDLAANYQLSEDKKTYQVELKQGVLWSDGEPFSANDVVYTFETIQNPEVGSPLMPSFQNVNVEKINDYAVNFKLKEPFAPFLSSLTIGILPAHIWENLAANSMKLAKNNIQPIGTGPWSFSKLIKDDTGKIQSYVLTRNDYYYAKKPYIKTISFKFFDEYSLAADSLHRQEVSALSFVPRNLKDKVSGKNTTLYETQLPQYTAIFFNQEQNTDLKDINLRLALQKSLDKNVILKEGLQGDGEIVDSPILKIHPGYNPEIEKTTYNIEEATKLLDKTWGKIQPEEYYRLRYDELTKDRADEIELITKDVSSTPKIVSSTLAKIENETKETVRSEMNLEQSYYRKDKKDNILRITITTADTPEYVKTSEAISKMWRAVGVQVNTRLITAKQISREALKNRNYEVLLYGEIVGNDADPFPFWHSSQVNYPGLNLANFANRNADKIIDEARAAKNEKDRADLYKKFQDILIKELPAIFLYSPNYIFAANNDIKGINIGSISSPADRYNNLSDWYIKTKWNWK